MKNLIICLFCMAANFSLYSQQVQYQECTGCSNTPNNDGTPENPNQNFPYGGNTPYQSQDISSDFGPRRLSENSSTQYSYDWHGGVDYTLFNTGNRDRGDAIVAIETGTVITVEASGGYKYIIIDGTDDFGYGHIFHSNGLPQRSGAFVLATLDNNPRIYAIVNTQTNQAIGEMAGTVTITDNSTTPPTMTQYTVQTMVTAGQEIAPIGGSSGANYNTGVGYGPHIHLYRYRNPNANSPNRSANVIDPLSSVQYTAPNYLFELHTQGEMPGTITFDYQVNREQTIKVNLWMNGVTNGYGNTLAKGNRSNRYASGTMDIDQVELRIKNKDNPSADYEIIQGPNFEAKLTLGGRTNTTIYPNNTLYLNNMEGRWNRTGIAPFAYSNQNGQAKDEYYFADIALRIHKNNTGITTCPMEVKYPDGNYSIKARATDVRNRFVESSDVDVNIDNFQPFIQSVQAEISGTIIYEKEWACMNCNQGGGISFTGKDLETKVNYQELEGGMRINVLASEPLQSLSLNIPELAISNQSATFSNDRTKWTFMVETTAIPNETTITFQFTGMDFNGNPLLALQSFTNSACQTIPIRTGITSWSINNLPTGMDESHSIGIGCGISGGRNKSGTTLIISSDDCLTINATTTNVSETASMDGAITLIVEGGKAPYQYTWENGAKSSSLENLSEGQYCVTITDDSCCEENTCITVAQGCMTFKITEKDK